MASHNDVNDAPNTSIFPVTKIDSNGAPPHLEDDVLGQKDGMTASPSPESSAHMIEDRSHRIPGKVLKGPHTVPIPAGSDPAMALLIEALNQTNALIFQQNKRIGALEAVRRSRSPPRRHRRQRSKTLSPRRRRDRRILTAPEV